MSLSISESDRMKNFRSTLDGKYTESVNLFYLHLQSLESTSIINWIDLSLSLSLSIRMLLEHAMLHISTLERNLMEKFIEILKDFFFRMSVRKIITLNTVFEASWCERSLSLFPSIILDFLLFFLFISLFCDQRISVTHSITLHRIMCVQNLFHLWN